MRGGQAIPVEAGCHFGGDAKMALFIFSCGCLIGSSGLGFLPFMSAGGVASFTIVVGYAKMDAWGVSWHDVF